MQTNKELFDLMKETYPPDPRDEFVSATEVKLRQQARKLSRKRTFNRLSIASGGLILCVMAVSWVFFFSGKDVIHNVISSIGENNSLNTVTKQEPLIYIYHSHNRESFIPEIKVKNPNEAFHESKNITLVGERLSQELKERKINNIHDNRDIMGILKERGLSFADSYMVSSEALQSTLDKYKNIKMVIDIHRDARKRQASTVKINGKDYAQIAFVVSGFSSNYEENRKFAIQIHKKIEEKYPGLSWGVHSKSDRKNTYNQDLLDNSVLLEIGGVENSLEEEYRTVDAFANIIEEILKTEK
jgi:stage II sporulation protein P